MSSTGNAEVKSWQTKGSSAGRRVSMTIGDLGDPAHGGANRLQNYCQNGDPVVTASSSLHLHIPSTAVRMRKRVTPESAVAMPSCNSDFLSGLFKDIANAENQESVPPSANSSVEDERASKRSKLSLTRSISRCYKSFANLHSVNESVPGVTASSLPTSPGSQHAVTPTDAPRRNTTLNMKHCVSASSNNGSASAGVAQTSELAAIAFPHLPATVSASSCSHLPGLMSRCNSGQQLPESENANSGNNECYGWFVEMEEEARTSQFRTQISPLQHSESSDLAFSAATAPKCDTKLDAEAQWAQAADTVDDVLGDFF